MQCLHRYFFGVKQNPTCQNFGDEFICASGHAWVKTKINGVLGPALLAAREKKGTEDNASCKPQTLLNPLREVRTKTC